MARMPSEDDIRQASISSRAVKRAPRDYIGPAVERAGQTITREADLDQDLDLRVKKKAKAEGDALDLARADADWGTRLANETSQYELTTKPKYNIWGEEIDKNLPKHKAASASLIQDPKLRELWSVRHEDDVVRTSTAIKGKALGLNTDKRRAEGLVAVDTMLQNATRPGIDQKESDRIILSARTNLDNLAMAGILSPEQVVEARQRFAKKYASIRVTQDIETNPGEAARHLRGGAGEGYYTKLRKQESSGSDDAKASTSSATGRYQFTAGTWSELRRNHPELALTAEGRTDASQQERAIRVFTADNARALEGAGLPASEANLYMAHFMGAGGAIQALKSNPGDNAAMAFPDAAAANKTIFYKKNGEPRTVGEVIALQTKRFSGESGPAPDYYEVLDSDDRLQLASAAEGEYARREKEASDATQLDRYAMAQNVDNDLSQIAQTGQSTDLNQEQVRGVLGDDGAAKWLDERQTAVETYKATTVLEGMRNSEITEHLEGLEPHAGAPNFESKQKVFAATEARATKLMDLRVRDPASSVEDSAVVKKAMEGLKPDDPTSIQGLVKARFAAQEAVKIPAAMQQPITKSEARKIIAPIESIMDMMDATVVAALGEGKAGDAASRRQAAKDAQKNAEKQIRETVDLIEQTYGPYAPRVLAFAIAESYRDKEIGDMASAVYRKLNKGLKPTMGETSGIEAVNEASIAEKAVNGELPIATVARGQAAAQETTKKVWPRPSQKAVDYLKANPQTAADFEASFGPGAAGQWLPRN